MIELLRTKLKERKYKKYIEEHRENIKKAFSELIICLDLDNDVCIELFERILNHDLSKYSEEEFYAYRKYLYPINKQEKENAKEEFEKAWEHHWKNNDHHWEHRQNDTEFTKETKLAILENICDWLAMGYRPIEYYNKIKDKINLPKEQINFLEKILEELKEPKANLKECGMI